MVSPHSLGDLPSSWRAVVQIFAVRASWPVARHCFRSPRMEGFTEILRSLWPASVIRQKRAALTKGHYGIRLSPATAGARNAGPARPPPPPRMCPFCIKILAPVCARGQVPGPKQGAFGGAMLVQAYLPTTIQHTSTIMAPPKLMTRGASRSAPIEERLVSGTRPERMIGAIRREGSSCEEGRPRSLDSAAQRRRKLFCGRRQC